MPLPPPDFDVLFADGATVVDPRSGRTATIDVEQVGELRLPTGRVYACDPFVGLHEDAQPFTATVEPGAYAVHVARARWQEPDDVRVAAAKLVVREEPVVSWELALCTGQDVAALGDDEMFGYGVDAGSGCFIDVSSVPVFANLTENGDDGPIWDAFEDAGHVAVGACVDDPHGSHNVAVFSSGWGDGAYPTWVGYTAQGAVACFVTEFFVVPDSRTDGVADE